MLGFAPLGSAPLGVVPSAAAGGAAISPNAATHSHAATQPSIVSHTVVQRLNPTSVVAQGSWLPSGAGALWEMVDDGSAQNDADYIYATGATEAELAMAAASAPTSQTDHIIKVRARAVQPGADLLVRLMCGATEIANWTATDMPDSYTTLVYELTPVQAAAITDYGDLRIKLGAL